MRDEKIKVFCQHLLVVFGGVTGDDVRNNTEGRTQETVSPDFAILPLLRRVARVYALPDGVCPRLD